MSSKLDKSITIHHSPATEGDLAEKRCEDCEFSTPAVGAGEIVLTCDHFKTANRLVVKPDLL